jgi:hypothetical protein
MAYKTLSDAMKDIFKSRTDLKFFGQKALFEVDSLTVAEISIGTRGTSDHFPQLYVEIQHKENGVIAQNTFVFEEYLKRLPSDNSHIHRVKRMYIRIWRGDEPEEIDWYIARPKTTKPIVDAIFEYIEMYS